MHKTNFDENIHYTQLHEIVAEHLCAAILNGELKTGEFIHQQRIPEEFGVSQIPVREVLTDLGSESLTGRSTTAAKWDGKKEKS
jgi:DNA-binding GntR family transcriptional regulator